MDGSHSLLIRSQQFGTQMPQGGHPPHQMRATATEEGGSRGDQANAVLPGVIGGAYLDQLRRLERYERRAFSKRQGAIRKLLDFQRTIGSCIDKINYF